MPTYNVSRLDPGAVQRAFHYDAPTGVVTWRIRSGRVYPGKPSGSPDKYGYLVTVFRGVAIPNHRLAWFLHYGGWPTQQIDHIDMDPLNNRVANLREATRTEQRANQRVRRDSTSGFKGVRKTKRGRYEARITHKGEEINLGRYDSLAEASAAYAQAAESLFGAFARTA